MSDTPVRLTHHDPRWRQEFEQTRSGLLQSCAGRVTQIEHIGGTALSGSICQPVLDVLAGVNDRVDMQEAASAIEGLYFRRFSAPAWAPSALTLRKPRDGETTHQVFLMTIGDPGWQSAIRLRDAFRSKPELLIRFEESKVRLWKECEGDRDTYEADKSLIFTHFIDQLGET